VNRTIPFVTVGELDGLDCYALRIDHQCAMQEVIDYLVSLGHRDIALFGGEKRKRSTYDKYQQYIYMLGTHALEFRKEYVQEGDYSEAGGYASFMRLLECSRVPTAAIAINDYSAIGALRAANEKGLAVPNDLSLVSFDNTFLSETAFPKLTSVDYNYVEFGKELINLAIQAAQKEKAPELHLIKTKLVIRDSCRAI
jgi:DNA-binding LacI/PurR family transcriptional regulator